jgi:hypothetical protein
MAHSLVKSRNTELSHACSPLPFDVDRQAVVCLLKHCLIKRSAAQGGRDERFLQLKAAGITDTAIVIPEHANIQRYACL